VRYLVRIDSRKPHTFLILPAPHEISAPAAEPNRFRAVRDVGCRVLPVGLIPFFSSESQDVKTELSYGRHAEFSDTLVRA
jgi:hypothetical protein